MSEQSPVSHNPYSAPARPTEPAVQTEISQSVSWIRWIAGTVVVEILITSSVILSSRYSLLSYPEGIVTAVISGIVLLVVGIICGRRYSILNALAVTQTVNALTWLTMLTTVWLVYPIFHSGRGLSEDDLSIFAMILVGSGTSLGIIILIPAGTRRAISSPLQKV